MSIIQKMESIRLRILHLIQGGPQADARGLQLLQHFHPQGFDFPKILRRNTRAIIKRISTIFELYLPNYILFCTPAKILLSPCDLTIERPRSEIRCNQV
jgi:hypothetical protein